MINTQSNEKQGFSKIGAFDLKKGRYSVSANIIGAVLLIGGCIYIYNIFPMPSFGSEDFLSWNYKILAGLGLALLGMLVGFLVKYFVFKASDAGEIKLHLGLMIEIYSEKPIKKAAYLFSDIIGTLPTVAFGALSIAYYSPVFLMAFLFNIINFVCNIPILIFLIRQPAGSYIQIEQGAICSFTPQL